FSHVAAKSGIRASTYNAVFKNIKTTDEEVLTKARYQPEFVAKTWDYLDSRVTSWTVSTGQQKRVELKPWLDKIEAKYGVDRDIVLAIWSMESTYGEYLKRPGAVHHIGQALATLAYKDKRRKKFARQQLIAALKIVQNGDINASGMVGSWAGAMGHTQFIPTSYQAWAVDINNDGKRDVWNFAPDALASTANLLKKNGWIKGRTWGYEVVLPKGFNFKLANKDNYKIADFRKMGVVRANGKPFPRGSDKAVLKLMGGKTGPAFLMLRNFFVLKRYNNADKYALGVGHLADRIQGGGPIIQKWQRGYKSLREDERKEVQVQLSKLGYYKGDIDGNIGSGSRKAIKTWQQKVGMTPDGFPSRKVLDKLRKS
ncbi:MAG: lytic murein transglycosylase, partial [Nitratireductor sp.]